MPPPLVRAPLGAGDRRNSLRAGRLLEHGQALQRKVHKQR